MTPPPPAPKAWLPPGPRWVGLAAGLPVAAGVWLGLGAAPGLLEALALGCAAGLTAARRRLRHGPPPPPRHEALLAALGVAALAVAVSAAGWGGLGATHPQASALRLPARGAACAGLLCLAALAYAPQLRAGTRWLLDVQGPAQEPTPPWGWSAWLVLGVGLVWQTLLLVACGSPLIQTDSWVNLLEPDLLQPWPHPYHHPPLYSGLIKTLGGGAHPLLGLTLLIAAQHALVLGMGLLAESSVRRACGSAVGGAVAGLLVVLCGHLTIYAHLVMSEVVSTSWVVLSLALVLRAARREGAGPWLLAAGLAAGLGTLTRQAMQGWFVAGVIALLCLRFVRWRRALALFLLGALGPVFAMVLHNAVFHGRPSLTAAVGRNLFYRLGPGMPDLTDPDAAPDDPYERARQVIWEHRHHGGYARAYAEIERELGWSDPQIEAAMKRFYLEQIQRHPREFAQVTWQFFTTLLMGHESAELSVGMHDEDLPHAPEVWRGLPRAGPWPPWVVRALAFQPTSLWPTLLLALLSPLLARGPGRALALAACASAAYFLVIPALIEVPLPRYRLPAIPFFAMGCGASVSFLDARLGRWLRRGAA
ncbi:MAG: hypothetical protein R3F62_26190 [Planctomycetota bacterium]